MAKPIDKDALRSCRECGLTQRVREFPESGRSGHRSLCDACQKAKVRARYVVLKAQRLAQRNRPLGYDPAVDRKCRKCSVVKPRGDFSVLAGYLTHTCDQCRRSITKAHPLYLYKYCYSTAKSRGHDIDLTPEDSIAYREGRCAYCGVSGSNGIDRIDSERGYVTGNMQSCCKRCNIAKNDMAEPEWLAHISQMALVRTAKMAEAIW